MPEKTIKTAFRFSRIDFYFVTAFYSLYDICMVDMKTFLTRRYVKFIEICAEKCRVLDALCAEKCIFAYKLCAEKC